MPTVELDAYLLSPSKTHSTEYLPSFFILNLALPFALVVMFFSVIVPSLSVNLMLTVAFVMALPLLSVNLTANESPSFIFSLDIAKFVSSFAPNGEKITIPTTRIAIIMTNNAIIIF